MRYAFGTTLEAADLPEIDLFRTLAACGARSLLIGRRALVALGLPVSTFDYDLWLHFDDVERLNAAFEAHDHVPNHPPSEARARGRYVIENGEHIDVMVARSRKTIDGVELQFEDAWSRRRTLPFADTEIVLPSLGDLILTKRWVVRAKDVVDLQLLEALQRTS